MKRDFSEASKNNLLNIIRRVECDKYCHINDWIGDQYGMYMGWLGRLGVSYHVNLLNDYQNVIQSKCQNSRNSVYRIFSEVNSLDQRAKATIQSKGESLKKIKIAMLRLDRMIDPRFGYLSPGFLQFIRSRYSIKDEEKNELNINPIDFEFEKVLFDYLMRDWAKNLIVRWIHRKTTTKISIYNDPILGNALKIINKSKSLVDTKKSEDEILKSLIGNGNSIFKILENDSGQLGCSFLSFLRNGAKITNSSLNVRDKYYTTLDFLQDNFDVGEGILKIRENKTGADRLGIIGKVISIFSELSKASERTVSEQLKSSSKLIKDGGSMGKLLYKFLPEGRYEAFLSKGANGETIKYHKKLDAANINAIVALASGTCFAVGDVMERIKDGEYNWEDLSATSRNTGIIMASSLVSSTTFGIVQLDAEKAMNNFDNSIKKYQDLINNTNAPTAAKVAMVVPGTVLATTEAVGMTVVDTLIDTRENVIEIGGSIIEKSVDNYKESKEKVNRFIESTNAPQCVKDIMQVPGTMIANTETALKTTKDVVVGIGKGVFAIGKGFFDLGYGIGDGIMKLVNP